MVQNNDRPYRELGKHFAKDPIGAAETKTFIEILNLEPEEDIARRAGMGLDDASRHLTTMASKSSSVASSGLAASGCSACP